MYSSTNSLDITDLITVSVSKVVTVCIAKVGGKPQKWEILSITSFRLGEHRQFMNNPTYDLESLALLP